MSIPWDNKEAYMWLRKSYVMKEETYEAMQLNFAVLCISNQRSDLKFKLFSSPALPFRWVFLVFGI